MISGLEISLVMSVKLVFLLLSFVVAAFCPAFALDCGKATLPAEKLVCTTPKLKTADEAMSAAYFKLLRQTTDPNSARLLSAVSDDGASAFARR